MIAASSAEARGIPARSPLKILIDATPVTNSVDGLAIYIVNLIKALPFADLDGLAFTILLNPGVDWPDLALAMDNAGFIDLRARIATIGPRREWDMMRFLWAHRSKFDLVHITSHNYPLASRGGVCTIHDMTHLRWFDRKGRIIGWRLAAQRYLLTVVGVAVRRADAIIAVSKATRDILVHEFRSSISRDITVIHEGWEHLETYPKTDGESQLFEHAGYLFFLGSNRVHKNLSNLLKAFELASDLIPNGKTLVISGLKRTLSPNDLDVITRVNKKRQRIFFTGYISNSEVRRLYEHADAFIFPSFSEGFGLPVLEAFHFGAPLLCSSTTSLPEIAGDAALYFDPADPQSIADCISKFYREPDIAPRLRAAGKARLELFSWRKAARETVAVYRRALERRLTRHMP